MHVDALRESTETVHSFVKQLSVQSFPLSHGSQSTQSCGASLVVDMRAYSDVKESFRRQPCGRGLQALGVLLRPSKFFCHGSGDKLLRKGIKMEVSSNFQWWPEQLYCP